MGSTTTQNAREASFLNGNNKTSIQRKTVLPRFYNVCYLLTGVICLVVTIITLGFFTIDYNGPSAFKDLTSSNHFYDTVYSSVNSIRYFATILFSTYFVGSLCESVFGMRDVRVFDKYTGYEIGSVMYRKRSTFDQLYLICSTAWIYTIQYGNGKQIWPLLLNIMTIVITLYVCWLSVRGSLCVQFVQLCFLCFAFISLPISIQLL